MTSKHFLWCLFLGIVKFALCQDKEHLSNGYSYAQKNVYASNTGHNENNLSHAESRAGFQENYYKNHRKLPSGSPSDNSNAVLGPLRTTTEMIYRGPNGFPVYGPGEERPITERAERKRKYDNPHYRKYPRWKTRKNGVYHGKRTQPNTGNSTGGKVKKFLSHLGKEFTNQWQKIVNGVGMVDSIADSFADGIDGSKSYHGRHNVRKHSQ